MPQAVPVQWKPFLIRIILPTILTAALFVLAIFRVIIPAIEHNSLNHKREMIRELTNSAWNILAKFEYDEQQGLMSREQAQARAVKQIRNLHYGQQMKDYFWINDMHPRMVIHPYRTDLNGQDLSEYRDPEGRAVFVEMVNLVRKSGAGYVRYMWQWKDDQERIMPKISYVKGFAPWGWIIGTGVYIEDVQAEVSLITRNLINISLVITVFMGLLLATIIAYSYRTERQRSAAERALRRSEEEYRTIFETAGTAVVILEPDLTIVLANSNFEALSGYGKHETEGKKRLADFVEDRDRGWIADYYQGREKSGGVASQSYEFRFVDRYGTIKNVYITIASIPGSARSVGALLDITENRRALEVLSESEERFRRLVENSLTGIFIVQDEHIVYHNPEQERLFGPLPKWFTVNNVDKVHPDDAGKVQAFYARMHSGKVRALDVEYRFYPMGAEVQEPNVRWAHCRASTIEYRGRRALLVNMMDVTRAKELESLLVIKDKMISLGHVAAGIAHEVRNPLSGINIFLDGIRESFQDPENAQDVKTLIDQAQEAAGKIESVVKGVLDFARPSTPQLEVADLNGPVRAAVGLSQAALKRNGIVLETHLGHSLPAVRIDKQQLEQVILNLITNASEALKTAGGDRIVAVDTAPARGAVVVRVYDSGPGIAPENKKKIFDPFYTTKNDGSGIGLSICQRIIADHHGTITVDRSRWGGALFVVRIPAEGKQGA